MNIMNILGKALKLLIDNWPVISAAILALLLRLYETRIASEKNGTAFLKEFFTLG